MSNLEQLRTLTVAERIQLVEDLWDTIALEPDQIQLSKAQTEELDRRLDRLSKTPDEGTDWDSLRTRILSSL